MPKDEYIQLRLVDENFNGYKSWLFCEPLSKKQPICLSDSVFEKIKGVVLISFLIHLRSVFRRRNTLQLFYAETD